MKIISWNVNGVRPRTDRLLALLERHEPDLVCLQETKSQDPTFPFMAIQGAGYNVEHHGQKAYNGVALISPHELQDVQRGFPGDPIPEQTRVISAVVQGVRVVNLYVVNGKDLESEAYPLKLDWIDGVTTWVTGEFSPDDALLLCGDFNIAPDERDVYDPEVWQDRVLVSEPERERYRKLLGWGLKDLQRELSDEAGLYTWWDYRAGAFPRNMGLRIDLFLGTAAVARRAAAFEVDRTERKKSSGEGNPSDHAPVIATLE